MKSVYYENGPDTLKIGPVNAQIEFKRGVGKSVDDAIAASLLKKPGWKEQTEDRGQTNRQQTKAKTSV